MGKLSKLSINQNCSQDSAQKQSELVSYSEFSHSNERRMHFL